MTMPDVDERDCYRGDICRQLTEHTILAVHALPGTGKSQGMARAFVNGRATLQFISCYHGREIARLASGMTFLKRGSPNTRT